MHLEQIIFSLINLYSFPSGLLDIEVFQLETY